MLLKMTGHSYRFECENLCRVFFPYSPVRVAEGTEPGPGEPWAEAAMEEGGAGWAYAVRASDGERELSRTFTAPERDE